MYMYLTRTVYIHAARIQLQAYPCATNASGLNSQYCENPVPSQFWKSHNCFIMWLCDALCHEIIQEWWRIMLLYGMYLQNVDTITEKNIAVWKNVHKAS